MTEQEMDDHEDDNGRMCANGGHAPAAIERNGVWLCNDCDMRDSGTKDIRD